MPTTTEDIPRRPRVIGARSQADLTVSEWTLAQTRAALRQHLDGDFHRSALLADAMRGDERIAGDLRTRVMAVTGLPFRLDPSPTGDQRRARAVAAELAARWSSICPASVVRDLLRWAVFCGQGFGPIRWTSDGGRWWPRIEPWHVQHLRHDDVSDTWVAQTDAGPADVVPGDGAWLVYSPEGARGWVECAVRGLAIPYHLRRDTRRDWGRFGEKHGLPITGAVVPDTASQDDKDAYFADLRRLGSEGVVVFPRDRDGKGFGLEMIEPKNATAWQAFEKAIYHCDVSIAVALLGQASHAQEGGSYAKATALGAIRQDLLEADAASLAETIHTQVLRPWARFNYGDADLAPVPCWDATPPEDASAAATTIQTAGNALAQWQSAAASQGFTVDLEAFAERFKVPLKRLVVDPPPIPQDS